MEKSRGVDDGRDGWRGEPSLSGGFGEGLSTFSCSQGPQWHRLLLRCEYQDRYDLAQSQGSW